MLTAKTETTPRKRSPEQKLCAAILYRALIDAGLIRSNEQNKCRQTQAEAIAWVYDEDIEPGSFYWVCESAGIEPLSIRRRLGQ